MSGLDDVFAQKGFSKALETVGWLTITNDGFEIPHFDRHLSQNAKARALDADLKKSKRVRKMSGFDPDKNRTRSDQDHDLDKIDHLDTSLSKSIVGRIFTSANKLHPHSLGERKLIVVAAVLSVTHLSEHWLCDAIEGTLRCDGIENRFGYFRICLRNGATKMGLDFDALAKDTKIPAEFYSAIEDGSK
jgi:hypothetical protein